MITLTSQAFVGLRQLAAKSFGMSSLPFVTVPHPYGSLARDKALQVAGKAAEDIIEILTQPAYGRP